ncbi:MAG TPA: hypothetical protein V6C82_04075 [Chroococcales cyanobacterium]
MKSFWLVILLLLAAPAFASEADLGVQGGVIQRQEGEQITIWANSPQTSYTINNRGREFFHVKVQWRNVPAGSFLVTPQGVADALSRSGGTILSSVSVPGGSRAAWQLNCNIKGDYRFAVVAGVATPEILRRVEKTDRKPHFAIHLGDGASPNGYYQFLNRLSALSFPTYILPGRHDKSANFVRLCGKSKQIFDVAGDRFVFLDNRFGRLGKSQINWLDGVLAGPRRNTFVFLHLPLSSTRSLPGMSDRNEVRRLYRLFAERKVTSVFAGNTLTYSRQKRGGTEFYSVGGRAVGVEVSSRGVAIHPY